MRHFLAFYGALSQSVQKSLGSSLNAFQCLFKQSGEPSLTPAAGQGAQPTLHKRPQEVRYRERRANEGPQRER